MLPSTGPRKSTTVPRVSPNPGVGGAQIPNEDYYFIPLSHTEPVFNDMDMASSDIEGPPLLVCPKPGRVSPGDILMGGPDHCSDREFGVTKDECPLEEKCINAAVCVTPRTKNSSYKTPRLCTTSEGSLCFQDETCKLPELVTPGGHQTTLLQPVALEDDQSISSRDWMIGGAMQPIDRSALSDLSNEWAGDLSTEQKSLGPMDSSEKSNQILSCWSDHQAVAFSDKPSTKNSFSKTTKKKKTPKKRKARVLDLRYPCSPSPGDVLFGKGGIINTHPGNKWFREEARRLRQIREYATRTKDERYIISKELVEALKSKGGRFLEEKNGTWYEVICDEGPRHKASQLLREHKNFAS